MYDDKTTAEPVREFDVLIVGAGFSAFSLMNKLRKQGLSAKIFEKAPASGGIWHWNQYPGARVDSDTPIYQLFEPELYEDFTFKERYADWKDLKRYFQHVEKKWDLLKDIEYNRNVDAARFDEARNKWLVECSDGTKVVCRWFVLTIGFASRRYVPKMKGMGDFQGEMYHTAQWPQWGVNLKNKRIAVIGTGASGIQTIQEAGPDAKSLTVYQRTPNLCLPMNQRPLDPVEEEKKKADGLYARAHQECYKTFAGFTFDFHQQDTFDATPEERERLYHKLMIEEGGFRFWLGNFRDFLFDDAANDEGYNFWRKTVLARVPDPEKAALLAPEKKPHPWGTKRASLEQNFYEVVSQPHISIVDVNTNGIAEITETGIRTADGAHREFDVIVLATGFDAVTGGLASLDVRGTDGSTIGEHWRDGLRTSMGISLNKFPNLFFTYGPQAPTAFANGPTCTQIQAEFIDKVLQKARQEGITRFEAKKEVEDEWGEKVKEKWYGSLFPQAKSWYQGANIPGRRVEPLNWVGGIPSYIETLNDSLENNFQAWNTDGLEKLTSRISSSL
ncbi:cyclohexanone monooxygenase [Phyllosticta citricarpa]|uniref:Cyclohexanone monooxygenase n=2 Tax=Phyllosticta TaxID=121621 RepID=A0ABR1MGQ6_9PEZI